MKKFLFFCGFVLTAFAQNIPDNLQTNEPPVITKMAVLAGISLLPFAVMLLSSFVKIVIVLALLRNAIGVQQTPPNQVINGMALLLTIYVMFPVGLAMYNSAKDEIQKSPKELFSGQSAMYLINVLDAGKEPLRSFLRKNCVDKHVWVFCKVSGYLYRYCVVHETIVSANLVYDVVAP